LDPAALRQRLAASRTGLRFGPRFHAHANESDS